MTAAKPHDAIDRSGACRGGSGAGVAAAAKEIRENVRERYAQAARRVRDGAGGACCDPAVSAGDFITRDLYSAGETAALPAEAVAASLGCGNPTALAELRPGEVVLDLGSGGGIDVLLSARRVGPTGKAYGLDMTDEMLALARENQRKAGVSNVEFLKGTIEDIPLPDGCVDVIISNCVINLSADKDRVLREAFRVLRPGGRVAVSDVVWRKEMPGAMRQNAELWAGCIAGALRDRDYEQKLAAAGFVEISIAPTRVYTKDDAAGAAGSCGCHDQGSADVAAELDGALMSAFIRARRP
jgi:SAM-dependent methyltransferase